ncbi:hypothetical protein NMY22_g20127 [Coprinellus aureogranulatus]|nr:hypothetical protein NMY22_g20127 [Coprinellus aureogranulatus]
MSTSTSKGNGIDAEKGDVSSGNGHRKTKRRKSSESSKEDEDEDEIVEVPGDDDDSTASSEEDEEDGREDNEEHHTPLPELVLGVTRLTYRHSNPTASPSSPYVIPTSPPPPPPILSREEEIARKSITQNLFPARQFSITTDKPDLRSPGRLPSNTFVHPTPAPSILSTKSSARGSVYRDPRVYSHPRISTSLPLIGLPGFYMGMERAKAGVYHLLLPFTTQFALYHHHHPLFQWLASHAGFITRWFEVGGALLALGVVW